MNDAKKPCNSGRRRNGTKRIGAIMADMGLITQQQIAEILDMMSYENGLMFGEACARLKFLTEGDIAVALAFQSGYGPVSSAAGAVSIALEIVRDPCGTQANDMRSVRNFLLRNWFLEGRKILAIVGLNNGAGASTFAASLAISLAQAKTETLLIDGDVRAGTQRAIFDIKERQGLSDTLMTKPGLQKICRIAQFDSLSVLPSGTPLPNPLELFSQPSYQLLCDLLRKRFDVILIDTPGFDAGPDALETAAMAGGALIVLQKNATTTKGLQALKDGLTAQGTVIVGYVFNDFS